MKAAVVTHWLCLTCGEGGSYDEPDTKTDTGAAAKHGHATVSAADPAVLDRLREQVSA